MEEYLVFNVGGVGFKMVYVEGGEFMMGAMEGDNNAGGDEKPAHKVKLGSYYIGETVVTQALWKAVMGKEIEFMGGWKSRYGCGADYPAYRVSWDEICGTDGTGKDTGCFLYKLNDKLRNKLPQGYFFALPTEAQWEYAARGGRKQDKYKYAGGDKIGDVAWHSGNSSSETHPVMQKAPNGLGLYDMSGNVWEWCNDWYGLYYYKMCVDKGLVNNPQGPSLAITRVLRGGSRNDDAVFCRVSYRGHYTPGDRGFNLGFRLVIVHQ